MADFSVLIRSDCVGAISALRKGSFRSPALHNGALLHNCHFMDLRAMPPLYLYAPGAVLKAEGVDGLSRETAWARRASESLPALRRVVMAEATLRLGSPISLDLFGTAHNTLVHCFHWPVPFPQGGGTGPGRVRTGWACCAVEVVRPRCGPEEDAIGPPAEARS